ncbi:MAG: TIGR02594 family protein [Tabrizicola sp.]|nr:TIGR02594 family protein [Tabrizicola sp.]
MPWLAEAKRLIGTTEVAGPGNNPAILAMAQAPDIGFSSDETPWCGLFVAHCISSTLPDEPIPANPLGARQWLKFGRTVDPQFGSVLVFWRGSPSGWQGHVGFYWAEDDLHYHVLGGNQSNSVNVSRMAKSRLLAATWPKATEPEGIRRMKNGAGITITTNEQ